MNNNEIINSKKYEICTILRNLQKFNIKTSNTQEENIINLIDKNDNTYKDTILNILCLKDKRIGLTTGSNILIFNQHNFKIDMIIPIKGLFVFQYLKDGNIIVSTRDKKFVIFKINKNKYNILQEFSSKVFNSSKKIVELTNNQIISISVSPYLEFFNKNDNIYSSFKILDLKYNRAETAKSIIEIPGNRIVVFSYKYFSLLVYDINTHKLLLRKDVRYGVNDIMSDLIDNKYIFVRTEEGMAVFNVDENFSETLYQNLPSPYQMLKIKMYEYLFFCDKEIYLIKFQDKKLVIKHKATFNITKNFIFESPICKLDEKKFITKIAKLKKDNTWIEDFLVIFKEI